MGKFEQMRERLPSLYRPDDDDSAGQAVALRARDVVAVEVEPEQSVQLLDSDGVVAVVLERAAQVRAVRLAPGRAPGASYALELFPNQGGVLPDLPTAAAPVRDGVARLSLGFTADRFLIRLKRSSLLTLFLRAAGDALQAGDDMALQVLQSHWFAYADRARYSPFYLRGRELRGWPTPLPAPALLQDAGALAVTLRRARDPLAQHLRTLLPPAVLDAVDAYDRAGPPSRTLINALSDALDRLVAAGPLFAPDRFARVKLSADAKRQIAQNPAGAELVRLNWRLLEEAYPGAIGASQLEFPYIADLGRLGALLAISPWREPPALRESVEAYRQRIARTVALYRAGLGTLGAIRRVVEAALPVDLGQPVERRDRAFWLEQAAVLAARTLAVQARGQPTDLVGPMMRWTVASGALAPAAPTVYIRGVAPVAELIDPTERPLVELLDGGGGRPPVGLAYTGSLAPDVTLRLRPAFSAWLAQGGGLRRADALPGEGTPADPTAPGPWQDADGAPAGPFVALHQTHDRALWALGESGELWRYDGRAWAMALDGLAAPSALAESADGRTLFVATGGGLRGVALYPAGAFSAEVVPEVDGVAVLTLARDPAGAIWAGTSGGARRVGGADPPDLAGAQVRAISFDAAGVRSYGADLGLFQHQPGSGDRYWYEGKERTEQARDWRPLTALPAPADVFLPPVRCLHRGPDTSLWIGTDRGLARYVARPVSGLVYETLLEAFVDLGDGPVHTIREDERGLVWFGTERGLLRYDGRDMWQLQGDAWAPLGRADTLYDDAVGPQPRGAWRFDRAAGAWQRFDEVVRDWTSPALTVRAAAEAPVRAIAWTDGVAADLGSWDGAIFTPSGTVDQSELLVRVKPSPERPVDGGIPAVPRLPAGGSTWRYLSLEPGDFAEPEARPFWTTEGRLIPPPSDLAPPDSGRYDLEAPPPPSDYDSAIFAYNPAARVWLAWQERRDMALTVRLKLREPGEAIDPAVLDRVWDGIQRVRPAGVRVALAVEEQPVQP